MPDFLIRGLDDVTMRELKARAEKNGRSLQAEVKDTLKRSVKMTREEMMESIRKFQEETKDMNLPDATEWIREDRDTRPDGVRIPWDDEDEG